MSTKQYIAVVFIVVFSILGSFYSGFFLNQSIKKGESVSSNDQIQKFTPNLIDELILITKDKPHRALITTATRTSTNSDLNNYTVRLFYFDGTRWTYEISEGKSNELERIPKTSIIPSWNIESESSYVLEQSIDGSATINDTSILFDIPLIHNEISIKSSPRYTKFMSASEGTLTLDGKTYDSYALYNRFYSYNPPENLILGPDITGLETEWLAFWDEDGNFYSIDDTTVNHKVRNDSYKAHSLAVFKDVKNRIQKSLNITLVKNDQANYTVEISDEIDKKISIQKLNSVNKSINQKDIWLTGISTGTITGDDGVKSGFGIYEQISQ